MAARYVTRRRFTMRNVVAALVLVAFASPLYAQSGTQAPPPARTLSLAGPRVGMTFLSDGVVNKLHERHVDVGQNISQFGWQFERQFYSKESGVTALNEWVFLLGGLDQNVAIPSLSWMVGLRTKEGAEFGVGPNVTPAASASATPAG